MEKNAINRRKFLGSGIQGIAVIGIATTTLSEILVSCSPAKKVATTGAGMGFDQSPLPYSYSSLEDVIDTQTMEIHYTKHAAGYSKNLMEAVKDEGIEAGTSVEKILSNVSKYTAKMRNNAGGHFNHELFWKSMRPKRNSNKPEGNILAAIEKQFSSFEGFKLQFGNAATSRFGSGWAWLYADADKNLKIGSTPNQDNPIMDVSDIKGLPILGLDVWEHAYYLKYQNKRAEYISKWWDVVNWEYIQQRYNLLG